MEAIFGFIIFILGIWFLKSFNRAVVDASARIAAKSGKASAEGFNWGSGGYCVEVYDGNSIKCRVDGRNVVVRLFGMAAPEEGQYGRPSQPFAREASAYLAKRVLNAFVGVIPTANDMYARTFARALVDEEDISLTMIKLGLAEVNRENLKEPFLTEYSRAEEEAKGQRLGMWA